MRSETGSTVQLDQGIFVGFRYRPPLANCGEGADVEECFNYALYGAESLVNPLRTPRRYALYMFTARMPTDITIGGIMFSFGERSMSDRAGEVDMELRYTRILPSSW